MNRIPAGILDKNIEFFVTSQGTKAFVAGNIFAEDQLPAHVINLVRKDMQRHPEAISRLAHLPDADQLKVFIKCKFGAMGHDEPDLTHCGKSNAEYWNCNCDTCPLKDVFRAKMPVANGHLSEREVEITRLIARGLLGKEISDMLQISQSTFDSHKRHIFEKVGVNTGIELTNWANKIQLV